MTQLKIESKPAAAAEEAIESWVLPLYRQPSKRLMAIIELAPTERTEPAPGSEKTAVVRVRIMHLEIPSPEQEGAIREAQRALYLQRTARGTLDGESGQLELSEQTLRLTGGLLHAIEAARLKAGTAHWAEYARRLVAGPDLTVSEMKHELDQVADGLAAVLATARDTDQR